MKAASGKIASLPSKPVLSKTNCRLVSPSERLLAPDENFRDCTANKRFSASHALHERVTRGTLTAPSF